MATADDTRGGRVATMWVESGIQFRSNLLETGARVPFHAHKYAHVMLVTYGWLLVREIAPDGTERTFQMANKGYQPAHESVPFTPVGYRLSMPAGYRHEIECLDAAGAPAELLCFWPDGWAV